MHFHSWASVPFALNKNVFQGGFQFSCYFEARSILAGQSVEKISVLMKSGREGHLPVICSTIPDKRSLVIQNHWMTLIKIWSLRAGNNLPNRLSGQKDREREGRGVGVDQNDNKLNQSQEEHWQTHSWAPQLGFYPGAPDLHLPWVCLAQPSGYHSLERHIPGLFPAALGDSVVCTRPFFFSPKYSVFYKNNCIFKYHSVFWNSLLCPQPRTEMGGITEPFTWEK